MRGACCSAHWGTPHDKGSRIREKWRISRNTFAVGSRLTLQDRFKVGRVRFWARNSQLYGCIRGTPRSNVLNPCSYFSSSRHSLLSVHGRRDSECGACAGTECKGRCKLRARNTKRNTDAYGEEEETDTGWNGRVGVDRWVRVEGCKANIRFAFRSFDCRTAESLKPARILAKT